MAELDPRASRYGLEHHGVVHTKRIHWNLTTAHLYEEAVRRGEGVVGRDGSLVVETGTHTGRSPNDKFVLREPNTEQNIWWGKVNVPFAPELFTRMHQKVLAYLQHKDVYVQDLFVGADPRYQKRVRFINELAWHNLFVRSLFIKPTAEQLPGIEPDITVIHVPNMFADPNVDGTRSDCFILADLNSRLILIGGTGYAGEQKKSIFSVMNYLLPLQGVLSMHCSANYGRNGDCALFFGLSGTGKTSLSADPDRTLIGDDEHAWSDDGVFNLEGGCYAKAIRLSKENEPQIWSAVHHFGTVLENVIVDPDTRKLDLDDDSLTENTRAAYPLTSVPHCDPRGVADHPNNIIFLTCDAFGVFPPIARLTPEQAMYHFLIGYTARVAGTEAGVKEPQATFSTCFGGPFMALRPSVYANLLGEKIAKHGTKVWLINTGWSGGPAVAGPGGVGSRIHIGYTRLMVKAALEGDLDHIDFRHDDVLNLDVPSHVQGVPNNVLDPRSTWANGEAYDEQAKKVAAMFREAFQAYEADVSEDIRNAGPRA